MSQWLSGREKMETIILIGCANSSQIFHPPVRRIYKVRHCFGQAQEEVRGILCKNYAGRIIQKDREVRQRQQVTHMMDSNGIIQTTYTKLTAVPKEYRII